MGKFFKSSNLTTWEATTLGANESGFTSAAVSNTACSIIGFGSTGSGQVIVAAAGQGSTATTNSLMQGTVDVTNAVSELVAETINGVSNPETATVTLTQWGRTYRWGLGLSTATNLNLTLPTPIENIGETITIWCRPLQNGSIALTAPSTCRISDATTGFAEVSTGNTYTITASSAGSYIYKVVCEVIGNGLILVAEKTSIVPPYEVVGDTITIHVGDYFGDLTPVVTGTGVVAGPFANDKIVLTVDTTALPYYRTYFRPYDEGYAQLQFLEDERGDPVATFSVNSTVSEVIPNFFKDSEYENVVPQSAEAI